MSAFDRSAAGRDRTAGELLNIEQIKTDRRADDVGDAVERSHFVEMNLFDWMTVHRSLGGGEAAKDGQRQFTLFIGQFAAIDDGFDIGQIAMRFLIGRLDVDVGGEEAVCVSPSRFRV